MECNIRLYGGRKQSDSKEILLLVMRMGKRIPVDVRLIVPQANKNERGGEV